MVVNVFSFVLGALNHHTAALGFFSAIGGCGGVLLSSLVWDRKMRKDNVAVRFWAIGSLVAWGIILANLYGWHRFSVQELQQNLERNHLQLYIYLAIINVATFAAFCIDKAKAKRQGWRIREGVLMGMSMAGGAIGGLLGMAIARHKVNSAHFRVGLPLMLALDIALVAHLLSAGVV